MESVPSSPRVALSLAGAAGLRPRAVRRLPGGTNAVWDLVGTGAVLRVAGPDVPLPVLSHQLVLASTLSAAGVRLVRPLSDVPVEVDGVLGTLWRLEEVSGPVCYRSFGEATRLLHDLGAAVLSSAGLDVPDTLDVSGIALELDRLAAVGLVSAAEWAVLSPWPVRLEVGLASLGSAPRVLVHDDLWAKNVLQTAAGAVLSDPDNLGWGRSEYDLAFVSRGVEAGVVSPSEAASFVDGYGAALPDLDTAWKLALFHRLRWVCLLLGRRSWLTGAEELLADELPRWARPTGPRRSR